MNDAGFIPQRKVYAYTQTINALPEEVFPLLCPVREAEWLDEWDYSMIYSVTGFAEPGAVFSTSSPGEQDTIWIVTKHDRQNMIVEFTRFTPFNRTCVLRIRAMQLNEACSSVDIEYVYVSFSEEGNDYLRNYSKDEFDKNMKFWEDSMNHYIATGTLLKKKK